MTAPIEDVSSLPGKKVSDQQESPIGKVKEIYSMEDGFPMWVAIEAGSKTVFVPLARLKDEGGDLRVPYSRQHIFDGPEIDHDEGISAECDHTLRSYYGIGTGDQELWSDNKSYATLVPEKGGAAQRAEDVEQLETPDSDKRTDESRERVADPGSSEMRQVAAEDVMDENKEDQGDREGQDQGDREGQDDREEPSGQGDQRERDEHEEREGQSEHDG